MAKKTPEELEAIVSKRVAAKEIQLMLDKEAQKAGYDSIISACSYLGSTNFGDEARSFLDWRDAVWTYAFKVEQDVINGLRTMPTINELLGELPKR